MKGRGALTAAAACAHFFVTTIAIADPALPPWSDPDDIPLPAWASSVAITKADTPIYREPGKRDARRGSAEAETRLPFFGAKRAPGCLGRWWLLGPLAWVCSDGIELSREGATVSKASPGDDGLPFRYFFVGRNGASGFTAIERANDEAPDVEYDPGFTVAISEERVVESQRWARTHHGAWIAERDLARIRTPAFHGEEIAAGALDFAWVTTRDAIAREAPNAAAKIVAKLHRFDRVRWVEAGSATKRSMKNTRWVRISLGDTTSSSWVLEKDLSRPTLTAPPDEIGGESATERWIDVDIESQTLVAYEGRTPHFATLVSTGKGADGSETATPRGTHRIWVKLTSSNMDNLEQEDAERYYSMEDVPYVQFFDKGVALHGAFWHEDFGHVRSHGCVNLSPRDAQFLFAFTSPHLPRGWSAVLPIEMEEGTIVRVR